MMTSPIMSIVLKNYEMAKICFFSKINVVSARKKNFKIFFQLLKVKITCKFKLDIYRLTCYCF